MSEDTRQLLEATGLSGFTYRDVAAEEQRQAVAARWPLVAAVNRLLTSLASPGRTIGSSGSTATAPRQEGESR